ncbi:MAG: amidohydrolase family protein [Coriobacteriia bacterium]|nr:amidohydrolase family protein [Coriobacteriia bacterium]
MSRRVAPSSGRCVLSVIDVHTHAFADAIAPAAVASLASQADVTAYYDGTIAGLIAAMDRAGVDRSIVAPVATKPSQVATINDWISSLDRERIIPFGAMHPDFDDPAAEMARLAELGVKGIKLHSQNQYFSPDEPRMKPIYEAAIDLGFVVLFHAGGFVVQQGIEARPADFARMLDAYPDLVCILAHMGSYLYWDEVREHLSGRDAYFDTAYVPRHLPDDEFRSLMRDHGIDRVLFGSDGPWTDAAVELAHIRSLGLSATELEAVLGGNALALLGR